MPAGRPLKYKQPKKIMEIGEKYFEQCKKDNVPYTITGLALALDISRSTLCDYAERPEYSNTIKRLKDKVEAQVEQMLLQKGGAGHIFWMKNHGWTDKTVQEVHTMEEKPTEELVKEIERIKEKALNGNK